MKKAKIKVKNKYLIFTILIFILGLVFSGCGETPKKTEPPKQPPPAKPASPAASTVKTPVSASPAVKSAPSPASPSAGVSSEDVPYSPKGKTDPFKSYIVVTAVPKSASAFLPPLQRLTVEQYKLVGIVYTGKKDSKAIVSDDAGKGYVIKLGSEIGQNNGKVVKILIDRIIVSEKFKDAFGDVKTREVPLVLRPSEGGR